MAKIADSQNPARIDIPPELLDMFVQMERRIQTLETALAELQRQPWQADIAAVRAAIPTWSTLSGKPATFPPSSHGNEAHSSTFLTSVSWSDVGSKPATFPPDAHTHDYTSGVTGKPATFPPSSHGNEAHSSTFVTATNHSHAWADITSKPSTFTPASHGNEAHSSTFITGVAWGDVTGKPSTFTPSEHGKEAHNPDFSAKGHVHSYVDFYGDTGVGGPWVWDTAGDV